MESPPYLSLLDDSYRHTTEHLHAQIKQLQRDYQQEQEVVIVLRKALNEVEIRELQKISESNEKVSELTAELAHVRSCVERGEAARRDQELSAVKKQRLATEAERERDAREAEKDEINSHLKRELDSLREELSDIERQGRDHQGLADVQKQQLLAELNEKTQKISEVEGEKDVIRAEKSHLDAALQQQQVTIMDLKAKIQELIATNRNQADDLHRTKTELDYGVTRENRLRNDLELASERIKSLEDGIEVERANHLETKFSAELIQLRARDLEGAVGVEKCAQSEASKAVDRVTKQLHELEKVHEESRRKATDTKDRIAKLEKERDAVKAALSSELSDKKRVVTTLSNQLEDHQASCMELTQQLAKVRKRLVASDDNYSSTLKELDLLVTNFDLSTKDMAKQNGTVSATPSAQKTPKPKARKDLTKGTNPTKLLDSLRDTLVEYKRQLDLSKTQLLKSTAKVTSLSKEVQATKRQMAHKDKIIEESHTQQTKSSKDLTKLRVDYSELERVLTTMAGDLQSSTDSQSREKNYTQQLSDALSQQVKRSKTDNSDKLHYLQSLYDRLTSIHPPSHTSSPKDSWHDLTSLVSDHVARLNLHISSTQHNVEDVKAELTNKEHRIQDLQQHHDDVTHKLSSQLKQREQDFSRQKSELELHYSQLIADLQLRYKKEESQREEAWSAMRASGSTHHLLESQNTDLHTRLTQTTQDNAALLSACALLSGAFFPLHSRLSQLSAERRQLQSLVDRCMTFKQQTQTLVTALDSELGTSPVTVGQRGLLRFRVAVIAVMAAQRLSHLPRGSRHAFTASGVINRHANLLVTCGSKASPPPAFTGLSTPLEPTSPETVGKDTYDWLCSGDLQACILTSMVDIQTAMADANSHESVDYAAITTSAHSSFVRLIERISPYFTGHLERPLSGLRSRNSLVRRLGSGVHSTTENLSLVHKHNLATLQETTTAVQRHLVDMTRRLEVTESERCRVVEELATVSRNNEDDFRRVTELQAQKTSTKTIDPHKYQEACTELGNALAREQRLQAALSEQSTQIHSLQHSLHTHTHDHRDHLNSLSKAQQELADAQTDMRVKEGALLQAHEDVRIMKGHRERVGENLRDAESALRTAAKDKEVLSRYIDNITNALSTFQLEGGNQSLPDLLLRPEFIPMDTSKAGRELLACQEMVGNFIEAYHRLHLAQSCLQQTSDDQRSQIVSLRQQLSDLLLKSYGCTTEGPKKPVPKVDSSESLAEFALMKEDSELSFPITKPSSTQQAAINLRDESMTPVLSSHPYPARPQTTGANTNM